VGLARGDVVLLTMKSQDTFAALGDLAAAAPPDVPVACVQNGVENERAALRRFTNVHGVCVMFPTTYLQPGVVQAHSAPTTGILDVGRYPGGSDEVDAALAAAFTSSTFSSEVLADVMRWKYRKLVTNLGNALEALCGREARNGPVGDLAREEGERVLQVAGIAVATEEEDKARRGDLVRQLPIGGRERGGGSSWQSLTRRSGTIETDYLNGEIVLLGRTHAVPTPVNSLLQRLANQSAREGRQPGALSVDQFLALLAAESEK